MRSAVRWLAYLWAGPYTLVGLVFACVAWLGGGRVQRRHGTVEVWGGAVTWCLRHLTPLAGGAAALTLGHVILGRDPDCLDSCRNHELAHVRQYERWGPFFLPAYFLAGALCLVRGRHPYRDNPFERQAREEERLCE